MSDNRQWDSIQLQSLNLPYNKALRELDPTPRIVNGINTYVTYGGKIMKRPGTTAVGNTNLSALRIDRLWLYETLDSPVIVYMMASVFNGTSWALYYNRLDGGSPGWVNAGSLRQLNASTRPHEATVSRGIFYVKGYPSAASGETLGTVIFNGTGGTPFTTFWGLVGPTIPARISAGIPRLNAAISSTATAFNLNAQNTYNLIPWSQDFTQTSQWLNLSNNVSITTNQTAPDGSPTATLVTTIATTGGLSQINGTATASTVGVSYTFSLWAKASTNSTIITLGLYNGTSFIVGQTSFNLTTSWQRFSVTGTATNTTTAAIIGFPNILTNNALIWGAQVEISAPSSLPGSPATPYARTLGPYNLPAAPFNVLIDYELITVLAFTATTGAVTSCLRGAQGTVPAAHNTNAAVVYRDWTASTHPATVNNFWAYSYAYQTRSGHLSNRSPLETNPDNNPSLTGPVINMVPRLQLYGHPDTVNVPNLVIFRSTDGGGTYAQIATVTNTGFNPISWQDQYNQAGFSAGSLVVTSCGITGNSTINSVSAPYTLGGAIAGVAGTNFGCAVGFSNAAGTIPTNPTWTGSPVGNNLSSSIASFRAAAGTTPVTQVATTATAGGFNSATTTAINTTGATLLIITVTVNINTTLISSVTDNQGNTWHALQSATGTGGFSNTGIWYAYDKAGAALVTNASHTVTVSQAGIAPGITFSAFQGTLPNHVDPLDYAAGQSTGASANITTVSPGAINASIGAIDPTPDSALNFQLISPTLTSNSPPPTVISKSTTIATLTAALTGTNNGVNNTANFSTTYNGAALSTIAPAVPFSITIDNEVLTVTALNTGTGVATVNRAVNGTIFANHAIGANVVVTPIVGIDPPTASTPIVSYSSRLWIGIGNILLYSAQEELNLGIPEEAWPSGTFGNFYRLQFPIVNLIDTTNALYVITTEAVYELSGSNLETFYLQPILHNIGGAIGHPQAITKYQESVIWLTSDLRIAILQKGQFRTLSEPLGTDISNAINNNAALISLKYYAAFDKEWIVMSAIGTTTSNNQTWIYDIIKSEQTNQDFWSTPWTIQASAVASGRFRETVQNRRLVFAAYDGTNTTISRITETPAEYVGFDVMPSVAQQTYDFKMQTNLWVVPPGDHVNLLRRPGLVPIVYGLVLEETTFSTPSTDPQVFYYTNDLWTTPKSAATAEYTVHDDQPIGYRTRIFPLQEKARRFAFEVDKLQTIELFEIQDFSIIYNADSGSGI